MEGRSEAGGGRAAAAARRPFFRRRKSCPFSGPNAPQIDYKDVRPSQLFVAGLWLGTGAAMLAGLTGALVLVAASDVLAYAIFAAVNALPVAVLVRQALLARPGSDGAVVWYPPGLLTAWLTGLALSGI